MNMPFDVGARWNTVWHGVEILVQRNETEVDRLYAPDIQRIIFVHPGDTENAANLSFALVELPDEFVVLPAETGFAGRVHFERQAFWASKACIYWADTSFVRLPPNCLERRGFALTRRAPRYLRVPRAELATVIERWPLEGPHSWDERRWRRIERSRPFANLPETRQGEERASRFDAA